MFLPHFHVYLALPYQLPSGTKGIMSFAPTNNTKWLLDNVMITRNNKFNKCICIMYYELRLWTCHIGAMRLHSLDICDEMLAPTTLCRIGK